MDLFELDDLIADELALCKRTFEREAERAALPLTVQRVLKYLHEHLFEEGFNVDVLSGGVGLGGSIRAHFKRYLKKSVGEHLENLRLLAAMRLLTHAEIEVSRIALEVGYEYPESFTRAFHRAVGCSPSAYRGAYRGWAARD